MGVDNQEDEAKSAQTSEFATHLLDAELQEQLGLSDTWQKLLGTAPMEHPIEIGITDLPATFNDPWSQLLNVQGVEMVDLQQLRQPRGQVSLNALELEQVLQLMREQLEKE